MPVHLINFGTVRVAVALTALSALVPIQVGIRLRAAGAALLGVPRLERFERRSAPVKALGLQAIVINKGDEGTVCALDESICDGRVDQFV